MKRLLSSWTLLCVLFQLWAQAPSGYYTSAKGTHGAALKTALSAIIINHTERSYANLWTDFQKTDARADGKVWDMYSSASNFTFVSDQCGTYKNEGDCYNREHSYPKSWFHEDTPMYTDLFHLYPTDGKVNGSRGNYPFGEPQRPTYTSSGGFSKLGPSSVSGYTGTVFEPADEYKGDFARTYFYMITCFEDRISGWDSDMLSGNAYPGFAQWALDMLLRWSEEDPVSEKEIERNNAVYGIQHNRNPYIDFPGLEEYVWGNKKDEAFDPEHYEGGGEMPPAGDVVAAPVFSPEPGVVADGTVVTISTTTSDAYIVYSVNGGDQYTEESPVQIPIDGPTTIEAYTLWGTKTSVTVNATYSLISDLPVGGEQTFRKVTSDADLQVGRRYIVVCESKGMALGAMANNYRSYSEVSISADEIRTEVDNEGLPYQLVLGGQAGAYTLYDAAEEGYLSLTVDDNKLNSSSQADDAQAKWTVTLSGDEAQIVNNAYTNRAIRYNAGAPRFACYKLGTQEPVVLYLNTDSDSGVSSVTDEASDGPVDVYTIDGRLVRRAVRSEKALDGLDKGLYIVKGKKFLVK
ncbi:MAG: endonuclease [Paraprevotella sp.]|nr:endonuclease [Paraprevotella sp.]